MIETVFALPILLAFLMMLLYFGVAGTRLHDTVVLARYEGWRGANQLQMAHESADAGGSLNFTVDNQPLVPNGGDTSQLNEFLLFESRRRH